MLTAGLGTLAWIDFKTGYLPDSLQIALTVAALAVLALGSPIGVTWTGAAWGAAINGCTFWSLRWIMTRVKGREAMGFGDVKLVAVGGLWLGPWALPLCYGPIGASNLSRRRRRRPHFTQTDVARRNPTRARTRSGHSRSLSRSYRWRDWYRRPGASVGPP